VPTRRSSGLRRLGVRDGAETAYAVLAYARQRALFKFNPNGRAHVPPRRVVMAASSGGLAVMVGRNPRARACGFRTKPCGLRMARSRPTLPGRAARPG